MSGPKQLLNRAQASFLLWRGLRRLRGELNAGNVSLEALTEIWLGWGNVGFSCSPDALFELLSLAAEQQRGTILEFGGGVSTLVLSVLSETTGQQIVTLEHESTWCRQLEAVLQRRTRGSYDVRHAPLEPFAGGLWYRRERLPDLDDVTLVFVDGPPGTTPGGRHGVIDAVVDRIPDTAAIVIDDTNRDAERRLAEAWASRCHRERLAYHTNRERAFDVLLPATRTTATS